MLVAAAACHMSSCHVMMSSDAYHHLTAGRTSWPACPSARLRTCPPAHLPTCAPAPMMVFHDLQVWYSSAWSKPTLATFRAAVTVLLATCMSQQSSPVHPSADALAAADVLKLLRHWQLKQVPLASARKGWQHGAAHSLTWITNFNRKIDRLALCELALTGELPALGPSDTGSVVMFAVPAEFGERAFDECFLQVCTSLM